MMNFFSGLWQSVGAGLAVVLMIAGAWLTGRLSGKRDEKTKAENEIYRQQLRQQEIAAGQFSHQVEILKDVQESDDNLSDADARMRMRESPYHQTESR